ncbi:MAG: alpha/beta fold hydrolase [Christensenellales bacterium]|jgi:pimeloyl-ACP methyl ester carboxylesterase
MNIDINNITVNYEQQGKGTDVLLLHGWGASIQTMRPIMDALKDGYRVTAVDFPGFGGSDSPPDTFGVQEYSDIIYAFLNRLGIHKTHIICHSFGGRVTIILASDHPELVDKIIFTDAAGLIKKRTLQYYYRVYSYKAAKRIFRGRLIKGLLRLVGIDIEKRISNAGSADYKALPENMKKIFVRVVNQDLKNCLRHIKSPSLLIWGENDMETPVYFGEIMEKEIPDAGLVVLKGAGHYAFLDCFAQYINIVRTFFGG